MEQPLTIKEMFVLSSLPNKSFGIKGYDFPKKYFDHVKIIKDRELAKLKKGRKKNNTSNKKNKSVLKIETPAPNAYNIIKNWFPKPRSKSLHINKTVSKNTYIDKIISDNKLHKSPGPGTYEIRRAITEKTKKKPGKIDKSIIKDSFLSEHEYLGDKNPGPGQYNPHREIIKLHHNIMKPADFLKKKPIQKVDKMPSIGSYNPISIYDTFDKINKFSKEKNLKKLNTNGTFWSKEERFDLKNKNKKNQSNIGPGFYNVLYQWEGKPEKKEKIKDLSKITSKHHDKSIYYDEESSILKYSLI